MTLAFFRLLVVLLAIGAYSLLDKNKYSFWKRLNIFYFVLLFLVPVEYIRITNLNRMGISFISEFLFSVILITLSLNLFIISWLMCQYDKNKMK
ncbi:hypothetical protein [Paramaledivibacter caminithermalis]|jgi:ABC-type glycerol-3-phosphate transport system permease component|uniref:Uncharacterized protein n=1 Tax=Paramaledivibacter caminithermalis (strain DSM 15212 / CIP 107654 / DViRD3) TaxID=1121301 RepID=A0A1M6P014_PARC5|nr:hypothetical protein [Paramaledivibacter caminithermalis]SHK01244.1 hypothetical protein SAMN02745912_01959 [Paramaledivibacter caminithermalis DSM 15212]